nr:MAG TPA: hypothetical protein [Herelleviridae sp.]
MIIVLLSFSFLKRHHPNLSLTNEGSEGPC